MKWRLTDDKRKEIIGDFECQLTDEFIKRADGRGFDIVSVYEEIRLDDIIPAKRYNPKDWNKFTEVRPPADVWMRCEFVNQKGKIERTAAKYTFDGLMMRWRDKNGDEVHFVDRFRPWED